jgi:hypothetical protein
VYSPASSMLPPSHLASCTSIKPNFLTPCIPYPSHIHIPSVQVRRLYLVLRIKFIFYGEGFLAPHTTPKLEDHPLSFIRGCLFNIFTAALHSWRPFLHLQPEDAPCVKTCEVDRYCVFSDAHKASTTHNCNKGPLC